MSDSFSALILIFILLLIVYPFLGFLALLGINQVFSLNIDTSLTNGFIAGFLIAIVRLK